MFSAPLIPVVKPELPTHVRTPAETEHVELSGFMTPTVELVALLTLMVLPETTMGAVPVYVVPPVYCGMFSVPPEYVEAPLLPVVVSVNIGIVVGAYSPAAPLPFVA
jgi:hypothetical protein